MLYHGLYPEQDCGYYSMCISDQCFDVALWQSAEFGTVWGMFDNSELSV